ncbi:Glycine/D-amino acid oxidase [Succinivibrio dextrinosolvens]|uniref:FAD-dependent oxidoreductase n=1 Tax=Succinivibrio dextrinosolvens TaxID=83771 RepID=UPI0008F08BFD|nr:FAD-dependent oxidoreductase [Succinivibrio dextrinosolvens]SFS83016.1 Glycine/D-amino acid oxidase [Succinivibrio dextrinosolvens]
MSKVIVIGGGYFGLYLAYYLGSKHHKVDLFEKSSEFMTRASYNNQARIHNGYHYPRSVLTALRSRQSFPRFIKDFPDCVCNDFDKYYMVGKHLSKVTAYQFEKFCRRIGAYLEPAPSRIVNLTHKNYIEACFKAKEFAFDSVKLKDAILSRIDTKYVTLHLESEVIRINKDNSQINELTVSVKDLKTAEIVEYKSDHIFNCTYASLNQVIHNSSLELIPLKHEMTEMALVDVPDELRNLGITVMCGPFFSVMPFPSVEINGHYLHSFSHVRYTPHYEWYSKDKEYVDADARFEKDERHTAWEVMRKDASRYIPILSDCIYRKSLWEVKTVLPRSEVNDSRPILCKFNYGLKGFHCVMGGKIDNAYDAVAAVKKELDL